MKFWDSSALVPLLVEEARSAKCRALRRADRAMVVWTLSRTEVLSAVHRLVREGKLDGQEIPSVRRRLDRACRAWHEVDALEPVRERAERVLAIHALSAADALQLGAALLMAKDRPRHRGFVTADRQLANAAAAEGFVLIVAE